MDMQHYDCVRIEAYMTRECPARHRTSPAHEQAEASSSRPRGHDAADDVVSDAEESEEGLLASDPLQHSLPEQCVDPEMRLPRTIAEP